MSIARKSDAGIAKLEKEIAELEKQETEQKESQGTETRKTEEELRPKQERTEERRPENPEVRTDGEGELENNGDKTDWKKRFGDLRRYSQKAEDENKRLKEKIAELESRSSGDGVPPTNPEEIKEWVKKFPQVAAVISSIAESKTQERFSEIESLKTLQEEISREREEAKIRKVHNDFDDIVGSDEFHTWAENQNERVQDALYRGNAEDVIWGISLYKGNKGVENSSSDKEAARAVKGTKRAEPSGDTKPRWSESKIKNMTDEDFEKHWDEIQEAQRTGKFVYDLSGGAR